jgi:hypothetical protein
VSSNRRQHRRTAGAAVRTAAGGASRDDQAWIDQGAEWPDALAGETPSPSQDPQAVRLISAAATNWATMALMLAAKKS